MIAVLVRLAGGVRTASALRAGARTDSPHTPTIGPGRTRDFDGEVFELRGGSADHLDLRATLDLEETDRVAGADAVRRSRDPRSRMRERSGGGPPPGRRAESARRDSSTSDKSEQRESILMKRASSQESLSHWQTTRSHPSRRAPAARAR